MIRPVPRLKHGTLDSGDIHSLRVDPRSLDARLFELAPSDYARRWRRRVSTLDTYLDSDGTDDLTIESGRMEEAVRKSQCVIELTLKSHHAPPSCRPEDV